MANNTNSPEQAMNLQEVTQCLERELRLRIETATNAAGSMLCTSPPSGTLLQRLAGCLSKNTTSPRNVNPSQFGRGSCRGLSPSPSASSDSSMSGGASGFRFPENMERTKPATVGSKTSIPNAAPARPIYAAGGSRPTVVAQSTGVQQMPNSQLLSSSTGRGKNGSSTAVSIGGPPAKAIKKRTRPSKKPPTQIVPATVECFRATVQELTGCKLPSIVRPQPERPQASAVPIKDTGSRNLPATSPSSMVSSVCNPSPTVSDRGPEETFPIRDSSASSSRTSSLNYCMGYERATPPFLDEQQQQNYDENLGQLPDESLRPASEPTQDKSREVRTSAVTPTGASVEEAALLPSESTRRDGIPRERSCLGSNDDLGFGSSMPDQFMRPSPLIEPRHRPTEPDNFGVESETWYDGGFDFMDWLNSH